LIVGDCINIVLISLYFYFNFKFIWYLSLKYFIFVLYFFYWKPFKKSNKNSYIFTLVLCLIVDYSTTGGLLKGVCLLNLFCLKGRDSVELIFRFEIIYWNSVDGFIYDSRADAFDIYLNQRSVSKGHIRGKRYTGGVAL
jgi:hypothetical protein